MDVSTYKQANKRMAGDVTMKDWKELSYQKLPWG